MSCLKCFTTHEAAPVTFDYEGKVVHGTLDFALGAGRFNVAFVC
jgi:hypothetical protein